MSDEDKVVMWQILRRKRNMRLYWIHQEFVGLSKHGATKCAQELKTSDAVSKLTEYCLLYSVLLNLSSAGSTSLLNKTNYRYMLSAHRRNFITFSCPENHNQFSFVRNSKYLFVNIEIGHIDKFIFAIAYFPPHSIIEKYVKFAENVDNLAEKYPEDKFQYPVRF
ncbi:unnamed protein product [Diabrotica balteata]|uniref:Myotubularin phosphatase domain-containing protein n=1 Tax=Diabrotica balteata TaxID=107213 RepID=A0A9N9T672_DIABA|nr:unnamed protein product [Diabrotica balteata]